jgi:integrase
MAARESTRKPRAATPVLPKISAEHVHNTDYAGAEAMKLTQQTLAALTLPADKTEHIEWDDAMPGFGVRLRKSKRGLAKSFRIQYRVGSQQRAKQLDARKVKLEDARKVARQLFAQAQLGVDLAAEKAKAKAAAQLTLGNVADRYLAVKRQAVQKGAFSASTFKAAMRYFAVFWEPLRNRPIDSIKRVEVAARVQELTTAHGRSASAKARFILSAMFRWAMGEGLCDANPVIATNNPEAGIKPRERVLEDRELKAVFDCAGDDDFGNIVKLLIYTGCRRDEIARLRWDEVNLETGRLIFPGARTKNRRPLALLLPAPALGIVQSETRRDGPCVFGDPRHGFTGWTAAKRKLDARLVAAGTPLPHWILHDLRRTMRTGLGRLGIPPHICELAINHAQPGIIATYDRYRYEAEVGAAIAQWVEHVTAVVEGRKLKVVPLRA